MSPQTWASRLLQQVRGVNPFGGDCRPTRVPLFGFGRPTLPFPHLWNYKNPIKIFETFYWDIEKETGSGKHNRYIYVAGLPPVLLTREPAIIKAVLGATGDMMTLFHGSYWLSSLSQHRSDTLMRSGCLMDA